MIKRPREWPIFTRCFRILKIQPHAEIYSIICQSLFLGNRVAQVRPRTAGAFVEPSLQDQTPTLPEHHNRNVRCGTRPRYPNKACPALNIAWRHPSSLSWDVAGTKHKPTRTERKTQKPATETLSSNLAGNHSRAEGLTSHGQPRYRMARETFMVRYADDFVMGFAEKSDAESMLEALKERFSAYGLLITESRETSAA